MSDELLPAGWPPQEEGPALQQAPLFPLPNVFLFPGHVMPLQIVEPRYRTMIEDCLDGPGRIVLAAVNEGHHEELEGSPPVCHLAGLGEIARHEKLADGRFLIWLVGLARVRIEETDSDKPYRQVNFEMIHEVQPNPEETEDTRERVVEAILARTPQLEELPENVPLSYLADLLLQRMPLEQEAMEGAYGEFDAGRRADQALALHELTPIPDPEEEDGEEDEGVSGDDEAAAGGGYDPSLN
ncbi:MAG: LON peptidase substrate-binding domain-containing protein [Planctomycetota bacterium]|jgi:Lon protease-like protein|nr:hypothetical protein [Planctomycetota bacterium]MDP6370164.1 LON peptidase substrate-binding domain-containing protein [Planctomycetota bacterium]MDP6519890.1 LON peptidase substrate-binding domain-containing protein [Planctomycetota bacterium]MDP6837373.1 LON peptidase substrate-binding domain-containing protein [Planctomycetota bacterium]MDP6955313.1 LON peptidase substrate-binding domain-containing protein [Planctomycetota bacterium]